MHVEGCGGTRKPDSPHLIELKSGLAQYSVMLLDHPFGLFHLIYLSNPIVSENCRAESAEYASERWRVTYWKVTSRKERIIVPDACPKSPSSARAGPQSWKWDGVQWDPGQIAAVSFLVPRRVSQELRRRHCSGGRVRTSSKFFSILISGFHPTWEF